jgi:hypothetical protein
LHSRPLTAFSTNDPTQQGAKSRKPDSGELPELLPFGVPLDTDHLGFFFLKLSMFDFDED